MKRKSNLVVFSAAAILIAALPSPANPAEKSAVTMTRTTITMDAALTVAQEALKFGATKGANMAVAIVDDAGIPLVMLRANGATEQFVEGATQKAWTSINLKDSTRTLLDQVKAGKEDNTFLPFVPKTLVLMGGVPLRAGGAIVGAIGAAGSPSGLIDDATAQHGAEVFSEMLKK